MNGLDLFIIACIGLGFIKGLFDGLVRQVVSLVSLLVVIFFAGRVASFLRDLIVSSSLLSDSIPNYVLTGLCYVFAFILINLVFHFLGKLVGGMVKITPVSLLNSLLGGILGSVLLALLLSLIFNVLVVLDPYFRVLNKQTQDKSVLFLKVKAVIPFLYPYVRDYLEDQSFFPEQKDNAPYFYPNEEDEVKEVSV